MIFYAIDIKLAGSLSLCISFPTVLMGIIKYRQSSEFKIVPLNLRFILFVGIGSIIGAFIGSILLMGVGMTTLQIILGTVLLVSAIKVFNKNH